MQLTSFHIKLVAAVLMVIDHVGFITHFFPFLVIGKLSYPLFVWLMCNGYKHTSNFSRYQFRLLLLAFISQPITYFFYHLPILNPVFSLWLGIHFIHSINKKKYIFSFIIAFASLFVPYGLYGLALSYLFSVAPFPLPTKEEKLNALLADKSLNNNSMPFLLWVIYFCLIHLYQSNFDPFQIHAAFILFALPFISKIKLQGPKARWFYWFYPLHFIPLMFLAHQI